MAKQNEKNRLERPEALKNLYAIIFIYLFFIAGIIWHLWSLTRDLMLRITPYGLFFASIFVIYPYIKEKKKELLTWIAVTYIITFILEVIGVKTGIIFGEYSYGFVLGPKIFDVPLIIGLNWVVIILGAIIISRTFSRHLLISSLMTGLLAVIFDLTLEPVAARFGYWFWQWNMIPVQNYLAWFIISFLAAMYFNLLKININSTLPKHYFYAQVIFFIGLNYFS
ncbi:MAG: carotenoid biosynthesis protein [Ignavibacteriaceae bacterium]